MNEQDKQVTVSNEGTAQVKSADILECNEILKRMIISCDRIGADLKDIKRMVTGDRR